MRSLPVLACAAALLSVPAAARADKVIVAQTVWRFDASTYTMDQGERLIFRNADEASPGQHNVTAKATGADGKPLFASKTIPKGQEADVEGAQRLTAGEYDFICTVHPFMQATLKVTGHGTSVADTTAPRLRAALRTSSLRGALATGHFAASITSDELAALRLTVRARGVRLARAAVTDGAPGRNVRFTAALTAAGRRVVRSARRLAVSLEVVATDAAGNTSRMVARRTLTR